MTTTLPVRPHGPRGAHAEPHGPESRLAAAAVEILNRRPAVGFALAVVRDGHLVFFRGHGLADIASHTPITDDTVFRIGSVTKLFTAIAVMQLVEQGRVELDAPASDYIRAYQLIPTQAGWRSATLRHLLTHTAGIPAQRLAWVVAQDRDPRVTTHVPLLGEAAHRVDPHPLAVEVAPHGRGLWVAVRTDGRKGGDRRALDQVAVGRRDLIPSVAPNQADRGHALTALPQRWRESCPPVPVASLAVMPVSATAPPPGSPRRLPPSRPAARTAGCGQLAR